MTYFDMLDKLLDSKDYVKIINSRQINKNLPLAIQIGFEQTQADIMCTNLNFGDKKDLVNFLIELDYATYIPFGRKGQKQVEKWLKQKDIKMPYEQFRKQRMYIVAMQCGIEIDENLKESIDKFCYFLLSEKQDFSQIESVAACVRQVGCELDNQMLKGIYYGDNQREDQMEKILDKIWTHVEFKGKRFDITKFLPPEQDHTLTPKEKQYFENITSLNVSNEEENVL